MENTNHFAIKHCLPTGCLANAVCITHPTGSLQSLLARVYRNPTFTQTHMCLAFCFSLG